MSAEAFAFIIENDPNFVNDLRPEAILLLSDEIKATLPDEILTRAEEGEQRFSPTNQVTRTNGSLSLLITIFKTTDSNIIQAYDNVEEVILGLDAANDDIEVRLVAEQASFVEESISGVAREGVSWRGLCDCYHFDLFECRNMDTRTTSSSWYWDGGCFWCVNCTLYNWECYGCCVVGYSCNGMDWNSNCVCFGLLICLIQRGVRLWLLL